MFGWLKNEALEVIEWREDSQDTVLYKFPDKDCNIKYGAQLTVRESQAALFLNEGQLADIYYPGRHTLTTENMPILTTLKSWKFGFNSPFKADVYFISTRQFANLKWGTPNAIFIRDPEMGAVQIRAFGVYFMRIKDPKIFFREYAGTNDLLTIDQLQDTLRGLIAPKFAEALSKSKVSAFDIYANYTTLGDQIRPLLQADLDLFGLELTKFQITSVSLPPELESHFTDMAKLNTTSDKNIDKLTRIKQANAVEKAAENGNYENFNMSQMMMQQMMMQNQMTQQNLQNQNNNQGFNQNQQQTPPAPKPSRDEIMKSLKDLGELKSMGILTEAEFEQKKKELLAQL